MLISSKLPQSQLSYRTLSDMLKIYVVFKKYNNVLSLKNESKWII